jgi:hypothetical protein
MQTEQRESVSGLKRERDRKRCHRVRAEASGAALLPYEKGLQWAQSLFMRRIRAANRRVNIGTMNRLGPFRKWPILPLLILVLLQPTLF